MIKPFSDEEVDVCRDPKQGLCVLHRKNSMREAMNVEENGTLR